MLSPERIYLFKIMECCIHSEKGGDSTDTVLPITTKSAETVLHYAHEWMTTRDVYGRSNGVIASKLVNELVGNDHIFPASCGYHRKCYQLFTNKKNLGTSKKRSIETAADNNDATRLVLNYIFSLLICDGEHLKCINIIIKLLLRVRIAIQYVEHCFVS